MEGVGESEVEDVVVIFVCNVMYSRDHSYIIRVTPYSSKLKISRMATYTTLALEQSINQSANIPLPPQRNNSPIISPLIRLLLHLRRKRNCTHNSIPKLLIQNRLIRIPIVLHDLIQSIDQRLPGWHLHGSTPVRKATQLFFKQRFWDLKERGQVVDVFGRGFGLTVEDGGGGYFGAVEMVANLLKGELFAGFSVEEGYGCGREGGVLRCLTRVLAISVE